MCKIHNGKVKYTQLHYAHTNQLSSLIVLALFFFFLAIFDIAFMYAGSSEDFLVGLVSGLAVELHPLSSAAQHKNVGIGLLVAINML